jgi:Zn-finger nucleic acid-binding protein
MLILRCPECSDTLAAVDAAGVEIDYCSQCGGIWLDLGELRRIDPASLPALPAAEHDGAGQLGACPRCPGLALWSHPVAPGVSAVVGECRGCGGMWIGASELAHVKRHVAVRASASRPRPAGGSATPAPRAPRGSAAFGDMPLAILVPGLRSLLTPADAVAQAPEPDAFGNVGAWADEVLDRHRTTPARSEPGGASTSDLPLAMRLLIESGSPKPDADQIERLRRSSERLGAIQAMYAVVSILAVVAAGVGAYTLLSQF